MNNQFTPSRVLLGLSLATAFLLPGTAAHAVAPAPTTSDVPVGPVGHAPPWVNPTITVITTADTSNVCTVSSSSCSLRGAIATAAMGPWSNPAIIFAIPSTDPNYNGGKPVITLTGEALYINNNLKIDTQGQSVTVNANGWSADFTISSGVVTINGLVITEGSGSPSYSAVYGRGAVELRGGVLTLANCAVCKSVDGIDNMDGELSVIDSTINGNSEFGVYSLGPSTAVTNCTFCGNETSAILATGPVNVTNSTVCGNWFGICLRGDVPVTLLNTLVAGNTSADVSGSFDIYGAAGNNLIGNASGSTGFGVARDDQFGTNGHPIPLSSVVAASNGAPVLANNGGPTQTIALIAGSFAIDTGNDVVTHSPYNLTTDQRGCWRDFGKHVDIGAYEYIHIAIPPLGPVHIPGLDAVKQESAPVAVSVTPGEAVSPVNESELIETTFRSEEGASAIAGARVGIGHASDPSRALFSVYDGATNLFFLADASGAQTSGYAPGSDNVITTSLGSLNLADTTVTEDGDRLVINWDIMPTDKLTGGQSVVLYATGTDGLNSGWHDLGSWTIFGGSQNTPTNPDDAPSGHAS